MRIDLLNAGKRYNRDWVFKNLSYTFTQGIKYAVTGPNGSGKSTLLQVLIGASSIHQGSITYQIKEKIFPVEKASQLFSFAAPYIDLIEEMTLSEFLAFHGKMKGWINGVNFNDLVQAAGLQNVMDKQVRYFSSGMLQRVKLIVAFSSNVEAILLDEPTSNLDVEGKIYYKELLNKYCGQRLLIIASNDEAEYACCNEILDLRKYKEIL